MSRVGLVLEGGGMRGLYTSGVLDCLHDNGIWFSDIYGVSAGACNATSYISRQRGRSMRVNTTYCADKRYLSIRNLLLHGSAFNFDFLFHEIPEKYIPFDYKEFYRFKGNFTTVCTDCETGGPFYKNVAQLSNAMEYVKASSSLPVFAQICHVDGHKLLDGGVAD